MPVKKYRSPDPMRRISPIQPKTTREGKVYNFTPRPNARRPCAQSAITGTINIWEWEP